MNPDLNTYDDLLDKTYEEDNYMPCLNMIGYSDECEMFYDLDEDEVKFLYCDSDGMCEYDFELCPHYTPVWEDEDED